jgi:hypothetical protein
MAAGANMTAGEMSLTSAGAMVLDDLTSGDALSIDAAGDIRLLASVGVNADGKLRVDTDGDMVMAEGANMTAGEMSLTSAGAMVLDDLTSGDALSIDAAGDIALLASAAVNADGRLLVDTDGDVIMADGSTLNSLGNVQVSSAGNIAVANIASRSTSAEAINLVAGQQIIDAGDIETDIVALDGGLLMTAGTGIGISNPLEINVRVGSVSSENGDITVGSESDLELSARAENGSVSATSGDTLTTDTGIYASRRAFLTADTAINVDSLVVGLGADLTSQTIDVAVTQNADTETPLILNVAGLNGQAENVQLEVNTNNAVVFDRLWSQDADIAVSSNEVSVISGQSDQQVSITTPLTVLQVENRSVVRKDDLDLQLYDKNKAFGFELDNASLSSDGNVVVGSGLTHSVDGPLGEDKDLMRYLQEILQLVKHDADSTADAESVMRVLADDQDKPKSMINLPEDPSQMLQLDKQVNSAEDKANNNARVEKSSDMKVSAIY